MNFNNIKALAFDFDGVFTNNQVIICEDGKESVICNRSDGLGLEMIRSLNIPMMIISTEKNPVVKMRAKKIKMPVKYGVNNKSEEIEDFSKTVNVDKKFIAFVGNDINDLECMKKVGFPIAVSDAFEEVKSIATLVLNKKGGEGAVRELCELIYKSYNK